MKPLILFITLEIVILGALMYSSHTISFVRPEPVSSEIRASWYGLESCVKKDCLMSNGERFDETKISCASRTHYGKVLTIEYQGKTIQCPVTDKIAVRYDSSRIDLSLAAFKMLENPEKGVIQIVYK